jgi:hypothetical protein
MKYRILLCKLSGINIPNVMLVLKLEYIIGLS